VRRKGRDRNEVPGVSQSPTTGWSPESDRRNSAARLEKLFDQSYDGILRYCLIRTGSRAVAEDVTAAVFVDAARRAAGETDFVADASWLYMVARRRLIDHWRSAERHRKRILRIIELGAAGDRVDVEDAATETSHLVHEALASLSGRQRALLTLRYLDGWSVTEIAEELELTYRAAESGLARARRSFLAAWEEVQ